MTKIVRLLNKILHRRVVLDFTDIFDVWVQGKCTTQYLKEYCDRELSIKFNQEVLERRKK